MYELATSLAQPFTLVCVLLAATLANLWRKRRETRSRLVPPTVLLIILIVMSLPAIGHLALRSLEYKYPPLDERPPDAEAIVILAGGVSVSADPDGPAELGSDTYRRCLCAADLYRRGPPCPVIASGGKPNPESPGPPFAQVMRGFLLRQNIRDADLVVEDSSRNTHENAVESGRMLVARGLHKVILVTDAMHMDRAVACFRKQGLEVVPAPCNFQATRLDGGVGDYLPNPDAAADFQLAAHEWVGSLWYWLCGRT